MLRTASLLAKVNHYTLVNVIQPNCRIQFTAQDVDFILSVLGTRAGPVDGLVRLLADEDSRDLVLDDEELYRAVLEQPGCLRVSPHLYFYVLVRNVFKRAGIENRVVADYVAEVLTEFSRAERTRCTVPGQPEPLDHFFEMLAALRTADDYTSFHIRAHMGNQSLFMSGIFPDHIKWRSQSRGAPDLRYYEELGRASYRAASDHRLARKYDLVPVFETLAERFQTTRLALNDLADRLCSVGEPHPPLGKLFGT